MIQAMQMQYAVELQNAHQDYGGRGYHSGHANYRGQGGCGAQCRVNWRGGRGGRVNRDLTHYCWTHGMCYYPGKYCRTPVEGHKKGALWFKKKSGSKRNCTWQVGSIPASKTNAKENKTYYTSELLYRSIVDPPQHATIIGKYYSGESNNYWRTEDMLLLTNLRDTHDGLTVILPNNTTMNATKIGCIPLLRILSTHEKRPTFFMDYTFPRLSP